MRSLVLFLALLAAACGGGTKKTTTPSGGPGPTDVPQDTAAAAVTPKPLFERLGGMPAITAVVDDFVNRTTSDPRIKERFFNTDAVALKKQLVDFVCLATGGPCQYLGKDMREAHASMDLVDEEFTALVENLAATLKKFNVPEKETGELLGALGPLQPQIVATPDHLHPIDAAKLAKATKVAEASTNADVKYLLQQAVIAGQRGQRNYAEQLYSRAELAEMAGSAKGLASLDAVFREGAPPRITAAPQKASDLKPAGETEGTSEDDADAAPPKKAVGRLAGTLKLDGAPVSNLGVVMLTPAKGGKSRTAKTRVVEQRDKKFLPHVLAVPVGSTVQFPNFDAVYHNVFSLSKVKAFDLGLYKNGEMREVKLTKPGVIRLGCNIHASMSAYVIVVDAPHYAVVDGNGAYAFKNLAPGKYKLRAWSEQSGEPVTSTVEVKEGDNTQDVDLQAGGAAVPTDKFGTTLTAPATH